MGKSASPGLSQRLLPAWLEENVAATGLHYLWPGLWHRLSHRPEVSLHLRCELLLQLRDGEQVRSLLDILPGDFEPLVTWRAGQRCFRYATGWTRPDQ